MDIRQRRERLNLLFPRVEQLVFDVGLADVVQDELDVRTLFHEPNGIGELWVEDTDVETQSVARECFNTVHEVGLDTEIYAFGLDESTDTFHERISASFSTKGATCSPSSSGAHATMP